MNKKYQSYFVSGVTIFLLLLSLWLVAGGAIRSLLSQDTGSSSATQYYSKATVSSNLQGMWALNNVNSGVGTIYNRGMTATEDSLLFLGNVEKQSGTLLRLNLLTGQVETNYDVSARVDIIGGNNQFVFVGVDGNGRIENSSIEGAAQVIAYEISSGRQMWAQRVRGARSISFIHTFGTTVSVVGSISGGYRYQLLDTSTGEVRYDNEHNYPVFYANNIWYYLNVPNQLRAVDAQSGNQLWEQQFSVRAFNYSSIHFPPVFTDNIVVGKTGEGVGRAFGLERTTGTLLWLSNALAYSNVAVSNGVAYFLSDKAELRVIDVRTGQILATATFEPTTPQPELEQGHVYNIAASRDIVVVYLGDSRQLFAFRFLR